MAGEPNDQRDARADNAQLLITLDLAAMVSGESSKFTISLTTSRGVKCSPASSFDCSAPIRISPSNT